MNDSKFDRKREKRIISPQKNPYTITSDSIQNNMSNQSNSNNAKALVANNLNV